MKKADHQLVQHVLDGDVTRETFDGFQKRLREEPALAELYGDYALLHHTLSEEIEGGGHHGENITQRSRRRLGLPLLVALAAILILAAGMVWFEPWSRGQEPDNLAVVSFSVDAVWQIEGISRNLGGATGVARGASLHLRQGRASISLEPSVTALIEGPADLTFLSESSIHLASGRGYFIRGGNGGGLTVSTSKLTAIDSGTEFGLIATTDHPDELHVTKGSVKVIRKEGSETRVLAAGEGVRVPVTGLTEQLSSDGRRFAKSLGRFHPIISGPFIKADWRVDYGNPSIADHRIEGENYTIFLPLAEAQPAGPSSVLLATLEVGKPPKGEFHTDGWAGMSFFSGGKEMLFFGDAYGTKPTWSLDVKQRIPVILPESPVTGPRIVTLRYDFKSAEVSLHEGVVPLKSPFCVGTLPFETRFDEIRIGASSGAALTVQALEIRVGGE